LVSVEGVKLGQPAENPLNSTQLVLDQGGLEFGYPEVQTDVSKLVTFGQPAHAILAARIEVCLVRCAAQQNATLASRDDF
jgi:hypothetical protein